MLQGAPALPCLLFQHTGSILSGPAPLTVCRGYMATPAAGAAAAAPTSAAKKKGSGIMASFFDLEVGCSPLQLLELSIAAAALAVDSCSSECTGQRHPAWL